VLFRSEVVAKQIDDHVQLGRVLLTLGEGASQDFVFSGGRPSGPGAFDRPGDYDYFRIAAGPQTLAARYAGRPASGSRIDKAVSKYTSVAA